MDFGLVGAVVLFSYFFINVRKIIRLHQQNQCHTRYALTVAVLACVFLPLISGTLVEPYVASVYGMLGQDIATDNLWLASICTVIVVAVLFLGIFLYTIKKRHTQPHYETLHK